MKVKYSVLFLLLFALLLACSDEADKTPDLSKEADQFPGLSVKIPHFMERLHSNRWQVRYCLLYDLPERDIETKRVLEMLIIDENIRVAQQAHMAYLGFIDIDKTLFRPELYIRAIMSDRFLGGIPAKDKYNAFVDDCVRGLRSAKLDERTLSENLTIVGIMGKPGDADGVYPYLQSADDGIAYCAAVAIIRLGDREQGIKTLQRLARCDPSKEPRYMFYALYALEEMNVQESETILLDAVAAIESSGGNPAQVNNVLMRAADFTSKDVWNVEKLRKKPSEEGQFPDLSRKVPYFMERLYSNRWKVRYCLLGDLTGRDPETKRALETLMRDENKSVANQATVRYLYDFVDIDKSLFKPELYFISRPGDEFPEPDLLNEEQHDALVEYCLRRLKSAQLDDPGIYRFLTVVGILGKPADAEALYPFLESTNDFVASIAAQAVVRIGDRMKGMEAFRRFAWDPSRSPFYSTEALYVLNEMQDPELMNIVNKILASIDQIEGLRPEWLNSFLLFAADVTDKDVWNVEEPQE